MPIYMYTKILGILLSISVVSVQVFPSANIKFKISKNSWIETHYVSDLVEIAFSDHL